MLRAAEAGDDDESLDLEKLATQRGTRALSTEGILFISQGHYGVDAHRPSRREPAAEERGADQHGGR